ncbi:collectin-12-like isoform X2 [Portunus trituberculatus]|nr:collectin-12-like isoform X2 [Portunus trituberculatus]XP_045103870.1 collectin-12-like isoform X2 [Portunus trituberculatus]XP_045103881.1 collectin-12-like isoform X2 [Portunus trituberculatus]
MTMMVMEQIQSAVVVAVLTAAATAAAPTTTFLSVARDMVPSLSASSNTTVSASSISECGQLCFAATTEYCLAFVWRPGASLQALVTPSNKSSNLRRSVSTEGRCELLPCLPHPASLVPLPGGHVFVIKTGDSTVPPPTFTPTLVPSSYSMACTFAYRVFSAPQLGYWQANRKCSQDGARLIVFKNPEEEEIVSEAVNPSEPYWIGLTDRQTEGVWRWADRSKLTYSNWDSGQPNNYMRGNKDQDCVMLFNGHWNDHQCQDALRFICQVPLLYR